MPDLALLALLAAGGAKQKGIGKTNTEIQHSKPHTENTEPEKQTTNSERKSVFLTFIQFF